MPSSPFVDYLWSLYTQSLGYLSGPYEIVDIHFSPHPTSLREFSLQVAYVRTLCYLVSTNILNKEVSNEWFGWFGGPND
jgi:hypothetical protein